MTEKFEIDESILLRYFSGEVTDKEKLHIEEWLSYSEDNRKIASDIYYIYFAVDTVNTINRIDSPAALKSVNKRLEKGRKVSFITWIQRVAAILFIPLLIGVLYNEIKKEPVLYMEVQTNPGLISSVELPDGTRVWLNSGSTLKYPQSFDSDTRDVYLEGEGYFSVAKDNKKKFMVNTYGQVKVEVLGTEFNVDAYRSNEFLATTLVEGSIRMTYMEEGKEKNMIMKPEQKAIFTKEGELIEKNMTYLPKDVAWKEGRIVLRDTPLMEVLWILSKRFNVEFSLARESLKDNSFTGTFQDQDLTVILEHLKISSKINYRIEKLEMTNSGEALKLKVSLF